MNDVLAENPEALAGADRGPTDRPPEAEWPAWASMYRRALQMLASERPVTFTGVAPIPFSAYDRYAIRYGINGSDFDVFCYIMERLDMVCLGQINKPTKG